VISTYVSKNSFSEASSSPAVQQINSHNNLTGISGTDISNAFIHSEAKKEKNYGKRDLRRSQQS
jgi:hypothetical protein